MSSRRPPKLPKPASLDSEGESESTKIETFPRLRPKTERANAHLIVLAGPNVGAMFRVTAPGVVVGRVPDANIRLHDDSVSRRHAVLRTQGNEVVIEDLGSANGTFVNGERIATRKLNDGDKIEIGTTTILKFTYHDDLEERFQKQMYEAAQRDGLTKAYNKRYFSESIETEFAFARRHQVPLSLLMVDIDHFKRVNDIHGHLAGDYVLVRLAELCVEVLRTEDVFARYGGEEFAIICRGSALAGATSLGERLRELVETSSLTFQGKPLAVTISIGIASYPEQAMKTPTELITLADAALYRAKRAGRNRVIAG